MAALYNTACCHARLGQAREGLLALSGARCGALLVGRVVWVEQALACVVAHVFPCLTLVIPSPPSSSKTASLEVGYADFDQIMRDADLELLRQDERFAVRTR